MNKRSNIASSLRKGFNFPCFPKIPQCENCESWEGVKKGGKRAAPHSAPKNAPLWKHLA